MGRCFARQESVSYTHLDVYKRQILFNLCIAFNLCDLCMPSIYAVVNLCIVLNLWFMRFMYSIQLCVTTNLCSCCWHHGWVNCSLHQARENRNLWFLMGSMFRLKMCSNHDSPVTLAAYRIIARGWAKVCLLYTSRCV